MPAVIQKDSKGKNYATLLQSYATSCGPTTMAMVEALYKFRCSAGDPEERVKQLSEKLADGWKPFVGTQLSSFPKTLAEIGVKSKILSVPTKDMFKELKQYVTDRTPAITVVTHKGNGVTHVVVCATLYPDGIGVFLDPTDGIIEVKERNLPTFRYDVGGRFDFEGEVVVTLPR